MKYCSMITMFYKQRNTSERIRIEQSLKRHAALGIKYVDLNLCAVGRFGEHQFDGPDWYDNAYEVKDLAHELGIEIVQTHLPFQSSLHKFNFFDRESYNHMKECTLRAMKISNIVGAQWAVAHPAMDYNTTADAIEDQIRENYSFYAEIVAEAENGCCGIAFENMNDLLVRPYNRKFCVTVDQLIALVDSFNSDKVQITWDFGHGNLSYGDKQDQAIRQVGKRLKAVHVADNFGQVDDHLAPYQGTIDWKKVYEALVDIGFDGYWDFEIGSTYQNLPDELRNSAMRFYRDIAEYMIAEFETSKTINK